MQFPESGVLSMRMEKTDQVTLSSPCQPPAGQTDQVTLSSPCQPPAGQTAGTDTGYYRITVRIQTWELLILDLMLDIVCKFLLNKMFAK